MKYFEDIEVGSVRESTEEHALTKEEIIEFCKTWDPLPFHVDEHAGAASIVGKLFTSAIHTVAIAIRLGHSMQDEPAAITVGLGWDEVRFHVPACAGDRLRLRGEITDKRVSDSKPDQGIIRSQLALLNQNDQAVITFKTASMIKRRPA